MIRVMIVDDHEFVRESMAELIGDDADITVVGACADGQEALAASLELHPEVVLMDVSMPGMNGVDATRALVRNLPDIRVIMLTSSMRSLDVRGACEAGAVGYLAKGCDPDEILDAIRTVATGGTAWNRQAADILRHAR